LRPQQVQGRRPAPEREQDRRREQEPEQPPEREQELWLERVQDLERELEQLP
jgi:hypothetical protein